MIVTDCTRQEAGETLEAINELLDCEPTVARLMQKKLTARQAGHVVTLLNALQESERKPRVPSNKAVA